MQKHEYIYRFDKVIYNPHKFSCSQLARLQKIPYLEASNNRLIKGLELETKKYKKYNRLISTFEVLINQICDFKIEIDKFEIKLQEFPSRKYPYVILVISHNDIKINREAFYPSSAEIDKVFKVMGDILSISRGCKVKLIKWE